MKACHIRLENLNFMTCMHSFSVTCQQLLYVVGYYYNNITGFGLVWFMHVTYFIHITANRERQVAHTLKESCKTKNSERCEETFFSTNLLLSSSSNASSSDVVPH